jgi:tetraacyldisaccharide 4'-kinase
MKKNNFQFSIFNFQLILLPFSWIFAVITALRNLLFDKGIINSISYSIPVISVGNITVGGTGKTPLCEYLIDGLSSDMNCALLSRGYGRKSKGVILANETSTYNDIGDEPMQIKSKFKGINVVVAKKRTEGMDLLLNLPQPPEVVIMDDAFQHRQVKPGLSILLIDYTRPIWKDFILPAGNLRESRKNIKRADIIIVNKCPKDLSENDAKNIKNKLKIQTHQQLFFTSIYYDKPRPLYNTDMTLSDIFENNPVTVLAGVANPEPFFKMVKSLVKIEKTVRFRDHDRYNIKEINKVYYSKKNKELPYILTTEKDAIRLKSIPEMTDIIASLIWYFPIKLEFLFDKKIMFDKIINDYVRRI